MNRIDKIKNFLNFGDPVKEKDQKNLNKSIIPLQLQRIKQDTLTWREAIDEAERAYNPHRVQMQQMYLDTVLNGHVLACKERRKDLTILRDWEVEGASDEIVEMLSEKWFSDFISYSLDAIFFGYSLISLGDIEKGKIKDVNIIKRWYTSPDRLIASDTLYALTGAEFLDKEYYPWHVWVKTKNDTGTTDVGFGLLYNIGVYEIFLRNILGYNGDFVELYSQPYRIGKTNKTEEDERNEFTDAVANMGSAGYAILDAVDDEIEFLESSLGANGYQGYSDFEKRLEQKISKIVLGHADALDSTSGKLGGSQGDDNPTAKALRDKQSKDGVFIEDVVNNELFPRLRLLGFKIPETAKFKFKNDHEIHENNERLTAIAVDIKKAGLQMDKAYFEEQTGITLSDAPEPKPLPNNIPTSIKNKLDELYR